MAAVSEELQLDPTSGDDGDDLSDQQIHHLLRDAEQRLRERPLRADRASGGPLTPLPK
jgi:hypothetical protein